MKEILIIISVLIALTNDPIDSSDQKNHKVDNPVVERYTDGEEDRKDRDPDGD